MRFYLEIYGCTANQSDGSVIKGVVKNHGHELVETIEQADIVVILTCTVIGTTEQRMISRLKQLQHSNKQIVVGGCMASIQQDVIREISPDAQLLPPRYSQYILDIITGDKPVLKKGSRRNIPKYFDDVTAPISIAEGCMFSCNYCITSLARGELTSRPGGEILRDVLSALEQGCKEIQLTAQDTASYGLDIGIDLGKLLSSICHINGGYKIRVGMMNPFTALKNLDSIIHGYDNPHIYQFLHLPVQSGDDDILKKMNRKYTTEDFLTIIDRFRDKFPDITLSTDVIIGFPTETEGQFQHTIDLLKLVQPDIVNITRYSARPYTKAKNMKGRIDTRVAKQQSKKTTVIVDRISYQKNLNYVGKIHNVLFTKKGRNNTVVGRSDNYKPVVVKEDIKIGEYRRVQIKNATSAYLVGKLI
jgi:MiaB-like tRNA modifying enzyme